MAQVYFHCSHGDLLMVDCCGAEVESLTDARKSRDGGPFVDHRARA
jgi:hypothetical protein